MIDALFNIDNWLQREPVPERVRDEDLEGRFTPLEDTEAYRRRADEIMAKWTVEVPA